MHKMIIFLHKMTMISENRYIKGPLILWCLTSWFIHQKWLAGNSIIQKPINRYTMF